MRVFLPANQPDPNRSCHRSVEFSEFEDGEEIKTVRLTDETMLRFARRGTIRFERVSMKTKYLCRVVNQANNLS